LTNIYDSFGSFARLFVENFEYDNRIIVNAVDNAPGQIGVNNSQFVAMTADTRHRARTRHCKQFALLQFSQQKAR
jgi:hypothetical protein